MNHKHRMYLISLATKFQKESEVYSGTDDDIANTAKKLASICYSELAKLNKT